MCTETGYIWKYDNSALILSRENRRDYVMKNNVKKEKTQDKVTGWRNQYLNVWGRIPESLTGKTLEETWEGLFNERVENLIHWDLTEVFEIGLGSLSNP